MNRPPKDFELLGHIGVDACICMIADPCYWVGKHGDEKQQRKEWNDFLEKTDFGFKPQINYDAGHPGKGIVFDTGYGDGYYNVYTKKNEEGRTIAALILFDEDVEE